MRISDWSSDVCSSDLLALTAGLDLCSGDQILIIDADLQDPPELLAEMRATMAREEADVVYAVRRHREGETMFKRATAAVFYRLLERLTDPPIPLDTGDRKSTRLNSSH